ncbi:tryptophan synthase subunit alpha [Pseudidiomarina mangrovi]|uniref:tryptophan synthase subunit alpha n=1 Tax=Pseudidiomarina mangrovi TaxID=2487133 RepID=UPI000FCAC6E0|nr:tryptophan synthase subunit alpha [Pseudidiomarina mangrovi]
MSRYQAMFDRLEQQQQGALVPFVTLGDPDVATSLSIIRSLIAGGADALELGLPFSDPVADGPTIQKAAIRALAAGVSQADCFSIIATIRAEYPDLPIGLLVYANLVVSNGAEAFYQRCQQAGVDSVLIADVPVREGERFNALARANGIAPIYIAPPDASAERLGQVAAHSEGYVYLLSRAGVTGADTTLQAPAERVIRALKAANSAPPLLGFGISNPEHVQAAIAAGAAGAISGSAVVKIIEQQLHDLPAMYAALEQFVATLKAATNKP